MKKTALSLIRRVGYDLVRRPQPNLSNPGIYYNVGAGGFRHPHWINIDFKSDWYSNEFDIGLDLMKLPNWPIPSNSADIVYSSHTVEHLTNTAVRKVFSEAHRILRPGGILRITTPNINLATRAYFRNDRSYFYWADKYSTKEEMKRIGIRYPMNETSIEQLLVYHFASGVSDLHVEGAQFSDEVVKRIFSKPITQALDYCISNCDPDIQARYPGNHINWWSEEKMKRMLHQAGFSTTYLSAYGQSAHPALRDVNFFDNTHPKISLYIECQK